MAKQVAETLLGVLEGTQMKVIRDRAQDPLPVAEEIIKEWSFDLYSRNPGPAIVTNGEFKPTDLDLATFMMALADRGAVIQIPSTYHGVRAKTERVGERVLPGDRRGKITGVYANADVFSFGVKILDMNVVQQDPETGAETVGVPRNFSLTGVQGQWHPSWSPIVFSPSCKENDFLKEHDLWTGNKVIFQNFAHPNRWVSVYGQYYFVAKAMIDRLGEEAKFLASETKRLLNAGVKYPKTGDGAKKEWPASDVVGEMKSIKVKTLEAEVDVPDYVGEYAPIDETSKSLVDATDRRRKIIYDIKPKLQFAVRTAELAFMGSIDDAGNERMPSWIIHTKWERDFVVDGKRTKWNRLVLFQPAVGQFGVAIRYRIWEKSERVAV